MPFKIIRFSSEKQVLLSFLLILLFQKGFAQTDVVTLHWNSSVIDESGETRLSFNGARYFTATSKLPYYETSIKGSGDYIATLSDEQYEAIPRDQLNSIHEKIGTDAIITSTKVTDRRRNSTLVKIMPFRINPTTKAIERLVSFRINTSLNRVANSKNSNRVYASSSVLSTSDWYKIGVTTDGIYKVSYDFLLRSGITTGPLSLQTIRLFGNGGGMVPLLNATPRPDDLQENAIQVVDENNDGSFDNNDYFLFYGQSPDRWSYNLSEQKYNHQKHHFTDTTYYFITIDLPGNAKRISSTSSLTSAPSDVAVNTYTDYAFHEEDNLNFIRSGREWYGEVFDVVQSQNFNFNFPNLIPGPVQIKSSVIARTSTSFSAFSTFRVSANNATVFDQPVQNVGTVFTDDFASASLKSGTFNASGNSIIINYNFTPYNSSSTGWLDYVELNVSRALTMSGDLLFFRDLDTANTTTHRHYTLSNAVANLSLWNVSDPMNVFAQNFTLTGNQIDFVQNLPAGTESDYAVFNSSSYREPVSFGKIANQNLHGSSASDMVIVTYPAFLNEAERLAQFHRDHDGLKVTVATSQQVFNEFSSGAQDVAAIRDFAKMFYDKFQSGGDTFRYVLLFGDGSYDNKNRLSPNTDFITTFQSANSISQIASYTSDDFFGMMDDNEGTLNGSEIMDLGVGRCPVKSLDEAREMVDKIITYSTPGIPNEQTNCTGSNGSRLGDWRNILCFVCDDQDHNLHFNQSERIAYSVSSVHPVYNIDKIVSDAYQQVSTPGGQRYPEVNDAITKRVEKGALVINYTGHGGEMGWAAEAILTDDMINNWKNVNNLPFFITSTCEFSRYDDPNRTSAGELVFLNANGGGIGLFTTVRLAFAIDNEYINTSMLHYMFEPLNGVMPRLGDILRLAKRDNPSNRNLTLLGDPAVRLSYPKYQVQTTTIKESGSNLVIDTLSSLKKVTVTGKVTDANGSILNNFNGVVYATVYDKMSVIHNLVNDATGDDISLPDSFNLRKNILYKGKASVNNGVFSCSFIVPRDIAYQYGSGRLSYYARTTQDDAQGYDESFQIGGATSNSLQDNLGPEIRLYMNDDKFVFGGITDDSPKIYATLFDSSGINTVGNGIGHDITGQLDGVPQKLYILNDYYESDLDSYQKGKVVYPLSKIASGSHTLSFKAWDINNNSSITSTDFVVSSSATLALDHVLNYPNPFTTHTSFFFEHNRPCIGLNVQVQIFTVSGKLVKTLDSYITCEGYRNSSLEWDGKDDYGDPLARGVYIYRLKVRSAEGETAQKLEKLVILR